MAKNISKQPVKNVPEVRICRDWLWRVERPRSRWDSVGAHFSWALISGGLLFAALCRMYAGRKTEEELREWLSTKDKKAQAELRKNPKVAAIIEQIKAERGTDDDGLGEDLLNELED